MANTYTSLLFHVIFSTKNREPYLTEDREQRVWEYIGGIARHHKMAALQVGGFDDHIHALVRAPPILAPSQIAQYLKGESSKWISETWSALRGFAWQEGYASFSVSRSNLESVKQYIMNQREHHKKVTFQQEYREFLNKHGVVYDEGYVWG